MTQKARQNAGDAAERPQALADDALDQVAGGGARLSDIPIIKTTDKSTPAR